jgi:hypothetical protein
MKHGRDDDAGGSFFSGAFHVELIWVKRAKQNENIF